MQPYKFDTRVIQRNLERGVITNTELLKHLAALPDLAGQTETITIGAPGEPRPGSNAGDNGTEDHGV